ncbi:hypothetical protein ZIOFF_049060 [Zingiber officinale]|uniref:Myb-like domain-containing protein n=1 Tax=Zingiber officinale TaxID=94328 RepID=A0A8J5KT16_ZINOF|nr:hypothetical protein ZIOFF_049060 [Zingiber officinale]
MATANPQQPAPTDMASGSSSTTRSRLPAEAWSKEENKRFELALARYGEGTPDRWARVTHAVGGGKSVDQVVRHYERLLDDIKLIETATEPFYHYPTYNANRRGGPASAAAAGDQEQRFIFVSATVTMLKSFLGQAMRLSDAELESHGTEIADPAREATINRKHHLIQHPSWWRHHLQHWQT